MAGLRKMHASSAVLRVCYGTCMLLCPSQAVTPGKTSAAVAGAFSGGDPLELFPEESLLQSDVSLCITGHHCWNDRAAFTSTGLGFWRGTQTLFWWQCAATISYRMQYVGRGDRLCIGDSVKWRHPGTASLQ